MKNLDKFFLASLLTVGCLAPPTEVVGAHKPVAVETAAPEPAPSPEFREEIRELRLEGDNQAKKESEDALWLLKRRAPSHYDATIPQLKKATILFPTLAEEGGTSHTAGGIDVEIVLSVRTREAGIIWLATALDHEACHVRQYTAGSVVWPPIQRPYVSPPRTGNEEKECLQSSYEVLVLLGADQSVLDYVKSNLDKL